MGSDQDLVDRDLTEEGEEIEPSFFASPKRMLQTAVVVLVLVGAIYILLPRLVGIQDAMGQLGNAAPGWLGVALVFCVLMFFSYVALFRGVVGERVVHLEWSESYQITMAGLAATRLFSAGGAGGIVLTYWALRKAGMERRQTACRMVAFLVLLYAVYMLALVVFGVLLRVGVLSGQSPAGLTIVPAAVAGALLLLCLLVALIPDDVERRLAGFARGYRFHRFAKRLASAPATLASGTRTAISFARNPSRGGLAVIGAVGFWACNIGILCPLAPGGVGAVDAGMIGTFVLFGLPSSEVFAAVLTYRLAAFWLPIPPGIVAFFQLRRTVSRWDEERARAPVGAGIGDPLRGTAITSESKV
jgi:hypothetical protein